MPSPLPDEDAHLRVGPPADHAAGFTAVRLSLTNAVRRMGVRKSVRNLRDLARHSSTRSSATRSAWASSCVTIRIPSPRAASVKKVSSPPAATSG